MGEIYSKLKNIYLGKPQLISKKFFWFVYTRLQSSSDSSKLVFIRLHSSSDYSTFVYTRLHLSSDSSVFLE